MKYPHDTPIKSKTHEISPLLLYYILHGWFNPFSYGLNQHFTSHIHVKIDISFHVNYVIIYIII